ncbi:hypothetical protein WME91_02425 [Sorangium sp. So ce269]
MPVARFDEAGRLAVDAALERGDAVVLPTPSPLAYVVAAKTASAVNRAKGRPRDQPVALWEPRFEHVAPHLALDEVERRRLGWLLGVERITALVPLASLTSDDGAPGWLAPAARYCVFRRHPATDSGRGRPPIPTPAGRPSPRTPGRECSSASKGSLATLAAPRP